MKIKNVFPILSSLFLMMHWAAPSVAQCSFDPTVVGDLLVCPESSTTLGTQHYDAYQWYRRSFPNGTAEPIPGATDSVLVVEYGETPVYISVLATQGGCSEQSPEVLADGLAFLPVTVLSDGEFDIGPNGEQIICAGDTIFQIVMLPYTINIQWYDGPNPIAGANDDTLIVTQPGNYWVTGSPGECPNYTASLGLQIPVIWGMSPGCVTGVGEPDVPGFEAQLKPNPTQESAQVGVDIPGTVQLYLFDGLGHTVRQQKFSTRTEIQTRDLPAGVYTLLLQSKTGSLTRKLVVL